MKRFQLLYAICSVLLLGSAALAGDVGNCDPKDGTATLQLTGPNIRVSGGTWITGIGANGGDWGNSTDTHDDTWSIDADETVVEIAVYFGKSHTHIVGLQMTTNKGRHHYFYAKENAGVVPAHVEAVKVVNGKVTLFVFKDGEGEHPAIRGIRSE